MWHRKPKILSDPLEKKFANPCFRVFTENLFYKQKIFS